MPDLKQKVALVTGGSRGIGAAIARRLAADGAAVAITYTASPDKAAEVVSAIETSGGRALAVQADAGEPGQVRAAVARTLEAFGRLDILVNNAGVLRFGPIDELSLEDFDQTLAVNVRGVFVASQEAQRHMKDGGRIINIGSVNSDIVPFPGLSAYSTSKAAVAGLTVALARELGPRGITVNNVQPGPVDTEMNPAEGGFADQLRAIMALGRFGHGGEIASFVAWLASDEGGFVTGANLRIDGGFGL